MLRYRSTLDTTPVSGVWRDSLTWKQQPVKTNQKIAAIPARHLEITPRVGRLTKPNPLLHRIALPLLMLLVAAITVSAQNHTPLTQAVLDDDVRLVKKLLAEGEEVNRTNKFGLTPLMLAASRGNKDMVDALLAENADVNLKGWAGLTALHWACSSDHDAPDILKALIKSGANVNTKEDNGPTPVIRAALKGKFGAVQILQSAGAAFTNDLVYSSAFGQLDIVKERLKAGANVNKRNESGRSPLAAAAANGHLEVVKILLEHRANVDSGGKDGDVTTSALIFAAGAGHIEVVKALLDKKASMDADLEGRTPLFVAVNGGYRALTKCLIDHGADPNGQNPDGEPVLFTAAHKHPEVLKTLLDAGANLNATNGIGSTALIIATYWGDADSVLELVSRGARTSAKTTQGLTALKIAQMGQDREQIVEILSDPEAATTKMRGIKTAKATTSTDSTTMTKDEWKKAYYSRFPAGSIVTVAKFKNSFGTPSRTQTVGQEAYWYYECSDGTIQVILNDPNLLGAGACIQSINDF